MKLKTTELFFSLLLTFTSAYVTVFAQSDSAQQQGDKKPAAEAPKLSVKLFEIKYQDPRSLVETLAALGSGSPHSTMTSNNQLRTLTVRDLPENIAAIGDALKRLDVPGKSPVSLECQLHLLSASMVGSNNTEMPKILEPVVAQLRLTLKFTDYRYVTSALNRVSDGGDVESSGLTGTLFPTPRGINTPDHPTFYRYSIKDVKLTQDASGKDTIQISKLSFGASVPVKIGETAGLQYKDIGIVTPLTLREGEIAAVGTVNISGSDEAIIVVISIKKIR